MKITFEESAGQKILVSNDILFIRIKIYIGSRPKTYYFYMNTSGVRYVSEQELAWGRLPDAKDWDKVKSELKTNAKKLSKEEQDSAQKLAAGIFNNFYFGITDQDREIIDSNRDAVIARLVENSGASRRAKFRPS